MRASVLSLLSHAKLSMLAESINVHANLLTRELAVALQNRPKCMPVSTCRAGEKI